MRTDLLRVLLDSHFIPVLGPPALTAQGEVVNVDADRAAAAVAVALNAEALLLLTNVPGLLKDVRDPASLIPRVDASGEAEALSVGQGRMHKKVRAALEAVHGGVPRAIISLSSGERPIQRALAGAGTAFVR